MFDPERIARLLRQIEPEFKPETWQAFRRVTLDGVPAEQVAADLGLSVNAVYVAKARVMQRLRELYGPGE
jgi:RNA polymerase sigma-70 factor (ECF subfamily)